MRPCEAGLKRLQANRSSKIRFWQVFLTNSNLTILTNQSVSVMFHNLEADPEFTLYIKEESDFRNERDVVPAGIRTGPDPQNYFFCFFGKVVPCNETPRSRVFRVF